MDSRESHIYFADAGAGKTYKLMEIVGQHIQAGIPLHRIAFVTFTKTGAEVAKQRVCERYGIDIKQAPHFSTIHSMCFKACKVRVNQMMDQEKWKDFGKKADFSLGHGVSNNVLEEVDWTDMTDEQIAAFEQFFRNAPIKGQEILQTEMHINNARYMRYCKEYVRYKRTFDYRDFTDLLEEYVNEKYEEDVDVACIDEAQDCTPLQWKVIFTAFRNVKYFYVVGDVKQSVFKWAAADPSIMMKLRGEQHFLDKSWRVPTNINTFVKKNIVDSMEDVPPTTCMSEHEGGIVTHIATLDELLPLDETKTYMMLSNNKKFLQEYASWCQDNAIPYKAASAYGGDPIFSPKDKQQYRDKQTSSWPAEKKRLADWYMSKGSFYTQPYVLISTVHRVKGDEADVVIVKPDLSRLAYRKYQRDPSEIHNVFYVACTRARESLYIMDPSSKNYYGEIL